MSADLKRAPRALREEFREATGLELIAVFWSVVLRRVCLALRDTEKKAASIASEVAAVSPSGLRRRCNEMMGIGLREYRAWTIRERTQRIAGELASRAAGATPNSGDGRPNGGDLAPNNGDDAPNGGDESSTPNRAKR